MLMKKYFYYQPRISKQEDVMWKAYKVLKSNEFDLIFYLLFKKWIRFIYSSCSWQLLPSSTHQWGMAGQVAT